MMRIALVLALFASALPAQEPQEKDTQVYMTEEEALKEAFPDATSFGSDTVKLDDADREALARRAGRKVFEQEMTIHSAWKDGDLLGYGVVTEEIGKYRPITFMVATDGQGKVRQISVLVYRESRGGEIVRKRFRQQFEGKSIADPIRIDNDILNVTGATLSVRAVTNGVRKVLAVIDRTYVAPKKSPPPPSANPVGPSKAPEVGAVRRARYLMGTVMEVTAFGEDRAAIARAEDAALDEVARLEQVLSHFRPDSELERALAAGGKAPVAISEDLFQCLSIAQRFWRASDGAFDPTVAPLVEAWGFKGGDGRWPSDEELRAALVRVGFQHVYLDAAARTMVLDRPDVDIDLGAIGKGYAVDRAAAVLRGRGVTCGLVNFSGNMYAIGAPPGEQGWPVLLEHPRDPDGSLGLVMLRDRAVSSSGDYEKCFIHEGRRYAHILDPHTGMPSQAACASVVLAPNATDADALSTTLCVLGPERGRALAQGMEGVSALIVTESAPGAELEFAETAGALQEMRLAEEVTGR